MIRPGQRRVPPRVLVQNRGLCQVPVLLPVPVLPDLVPLLPDLVPEAGSAKWCRHLEADPVRRKAP